MRCPSCTIRRVLFVAAGCSVGGCGFLADTFFPSEASRQNPLEFCGDRVADTTRQSSTLQDARVQDAPRQAFESELVAYTELGVCQVVWHMSAVPHDLSREPEFMEHTSGPALALEWHYDADATVIDGPDCADTWVGELVDADYRFETRAHAIALDLNAYASLMTFDSYFGYGYANVAELDEPEVINGDFGFVIDPEFGTVAGVPPSAGTGCMIDLPD